MPILWKSVWKKVKVAATNVSWQFMLAFAILHLVLTWWLLWFANEDSLLEGVTYLYFYITTAMTVGYGDLSPKTDAGRLIAAFWLMPGAISITAALIGKIAGELVTYWRRGMTGQRDYNKALEHHTVIMGWHPPRTLQMIKLLIEEVGPQERIVLIASDIVENPLPEQIRFVRGESISSMDVLARASVEDAKKVLIYAKNDDETLTTSLAVAAYPHKAHVVAHFEDQEKAQLLRSHCPEIEIISDLTVEILVRSAQDPGSSKVTTELVSTLSGPTQYCSPLPVQLSDKTFEELMLILKRQHDATLLGIATDAKGKSITLNPPADHVVTTGWLYYIAHQRLPS